MNRIVIEFKSDGSIKRVISDTPVQVFMVDDNHPEDRVYELTQGHMLQVGPEKVRQSLRDDPVGHRGQTVDNLPPKPPSRPVLKAVE
jgi:hypothetical protein